MVEQEESMSSVDSPSMFAQVIQEHLELKRRNAALEHEMPIEKYMNDDPFENHPLFKTEEQARIEETMDGEESIPAEMLVALAPPEQAPDDDTLWGRSRDFDWGD